MAAPSLPAASDHRRVGDCVVTIEVESGAIGRGAATTQVHVVPLIVQPALHVTPQLPDAQVATPFAGAGHAFVQLPQCSGSVAVVKHADPHRVEPAGQLPEQALFTHVAVPPVGAVHACPHVPQLFTSSVRRTHDIPQRVCPVAHPLAHANVVPLAEHTGDADGHTVPHVPQFVGDAMLVSQPSLAVPLQSSKPALQRVAQMPVVQLAVVFGAVGQTFPHTPQ